MKKPLEELIITIQRNADGAFDINVYDITNKNNEFLEDNEPIDGGICTGSMKNAINVACDMAHALNGEKGTKLDQKMKRINYETLDSNNLCPECGSKETYRNSCGELQCDNCGYESNDLEDYD